MDPATGQAQPPEAAAQQGDGTGEGQGGFGDLFDLSTVPDDLRPYVEEQVRKINSNVETKFREHADFRKKFEPFEQIEGLGDVEPEVLTELMQFREIANDPEQFERWWNAIGDEYGYFDGEGEGGDGSGEGEPGDEPPAWAQELREEIEALKQGFEPVKQHVTKDEERQRQDAARQELTTQLGRVKEQLGDDYSDDVEQALIDLAHGYVDEDDPISKAFERWKSITGRAQGELVDTKLNQPGGALSGGQADTAPQEFEGLNDPALKQAAKARFAAAR